jgi:EthD domain-containing protein
LIWFDDSAALRAATSSPEWARVKADEDNFLASGPVAFIVTTEHVIVA